MKYNKLIFFVFIMLFDGACKIQAQYIFTPSQIFSVKVNGTPVFTEYYKTVPDELNTSGTAIRWPLENVSIAHFNFTGNVTVEVTCSKPFSNYNLSPKRYNITHTKNGNTISFTINKPGKFNINFDNDQTVNEQLFIFADILESKPDLNDANVKNIMNFGVNNSGLIDNTSNIQNAINGLTTGQTLFFPKGQYLSKSIRLKSDMTLYLEAGAILLGTENYSDYQSAGSFVLINNCINTTVKGYGRINQRGEKMQRNFGSNASSRNVKVTGNSNNILLEDFFSVDPPRLNIELGADNTSVINVKALSTQAGDNTDGIDSWNGQNIVYDNTFIYGRDDAIAIKSFGKNTRKITVSNSIFSSLESCMKVGTETESDSIFDITFENCDAIYAGNAMSLWSYDKAKIKNINWRNIGIDRLKPSSFTNQGTHFLMEILPRNNSRNPGNIEQVTIEKVTAEKKALVNKNYIAGDDTDSKIENVKFNDLTITGNLVTSSNQNNYFTIGNFVSNLIFGSVQYNLINIGASQVQITEGQSASFIIKRSGDISGTSNVEYYIRGTAKNGIDYTAIPTSILFNPGESQKIINIASITDTNNEQVEQVCISLRPSTNKSYMLDTAFIAVINIIDANYNGTDIIRSDPEISVVVNPPLPVLDSGFSAYYDSVNRTLRIKRNSSVKTKLILLDISGKLYFTQEFSGVEIVLPVSKLAKGIYVIQVGGESKKVMIG